MACDRSTEVEKALAVGAPTDERNLSQSQFCVTRNTKGIRDSSFHRCEVHDGIYGHLVEETVSGHDTTPA